HGGVAWNRSQFDRRQEPADADAHRGQTCTAHPRRIRRDAWPSSHGRRRRAVLGPGHRDLLGRPRALVRRRISRENRRRAISHASGSSILMTSADSSTSADLSWLRTFNESRSLLFSIAYRMVGSVADAEDIIQDAFIRWQQTSRTDIRSPKAF